ncbi:lipoate--protein ligase [Aminivibrio sp.]
MGAIETFIAGSPYVSPWINLAFEENLLPLASDRGIILYLWRNQHTVVIGRNQNAWKECRTALLEEEGGTLARRLSGGGAVYHDLGNLNFTFFTSPRHYDVSRQTEVLIRALQFLGISAVRTGRNDISVHDRKVSGNAYYSGKAGRFHHGSILINGNIDRMSRYLQPSEAKLRGKGIDSVRSRVANLREFQNSITVDGVKNAIAAAFLDEYGGRGEPIDLCDMLDDGGFQFLLNKYSSRDWIYGRSPCFDLTVERRFEWGSMELGFSILEGRIAGCQVYSDGMRGEIIAELGGYLEGIPLDGSALGVALRKPFGEEIPREVEDTASWIEKEWSRLV